MKKALHGYQLQLEQKCDELCFLQYVEGLDPTRLGYGLSSRLSRMFDRRDGVSLQDVKARIVATRREIDLLMAAVWALVEVHPCRGFRLLMAPRPRKLRSSNAWLVPLWARHVSKTSHVEAVRLSLPQLLNEPRLQRECQAFECMQPRAVKKVFSANGFLMIDKIARQKGTTLEQVLTAGNIVSIVTERMDRETTNKNLVAEHLPVWRTITVPNALNADGSSNGVTRVRGRVIELERLRYLARQFNNCINTRSYRRSVEMGKSAVVALFSPESAKPVAFVRLKKGERPVEFATRLPAECNFTRDALEEAVQKAFNDDTWRKAIGAEPQTHLPSEKAGALTTLSAFVAPSDRNFAWRGRVKSVSRCEHAMVATSAHRAAAVLKELIQSGDNSDGESMAAVLRWLRTEAEVPDVCLPLVPLAIDSLTARVAMRRARDRYTRLAEDESVYGARVVAQALFENVHERSTVDEWRGRSVTAVLASSASASLTLDQVPAACYD